MGEHTEEPADLDDNEENKEEQQDDAMDLLNQVNLEAMNKYRREHGVEPVEFDPELARQAYKWA